MKRLHLDRHPRDAAHPEASLAEGEGRAPTRIAHPTRREATAIRRAIALITVLTVLLLGGGFAADTAQTRTAERYLRASEAVRRQVQANELADALDKQRLLHAQWQGDALWLNLLASHHHTRAVNTALTQLGTALDESARMEALQALDALLDALTDVAESDAPKLGNIL